MGDRSGHRRHGHGQRLSARHARCRRWEGHSRGRSARVETAESRITGVYRRSGPCSVRLLVGIAERNRDFPPRKTGRVFPARIAPGCFLGRLHRCAHRGLNRWTEGCTEGRRTVGKPPTVAAGQGAWASLGKPLTPPPGGPGGGRRWSRAGGRPMRRRGSSRSHPVGQPTQRHIVRRPPDTSTTTRTTRATGRSTPPALRRRVADEPGRRRRVRLRHPPYVSEMTYADEHQEHEQLHADASCKICHADPNDARTDLPHLCITSRRRLQRVHACTSTRVHAKRGTPLATGTGHGSAPPSSASSGVQNRRTSCVTETVTPHALRMTLVSSVTISARLTDACGASSCCLAGAVDGVPAPSLPAAGCAPGARARLAPSLRGPARGGRRTRRDRGRCAPGSATA